MHKTLSVTTVLLMLAILSSCFPKLERSGVTVIAGISIEAECQTLDIQRDLMLNETYGLTEWMIEIPFQVQPYDNKSSFKYYESHELDTILPKLKSQQIPYNLGFNIENPRNVPISQARIEHYLTDISGMLLRTAKVNYFPKRLIFMGELINPDFTKGKLKRFVLEIRKELPAFTGDILLAATPKALQGASFPWDIPDAIGIIFHEPPDPEFKPYFRKTNQVLSQLLIDHQKSALIVQTNLVGREKLLLFKNQLRFWDEKVVIEGIVINSLFCEFPLADSSSHFGLAKDKQFQSYLKRYTSE